MRVQLKLPAVAAFIAVSVTGRVALTDVDSNPSSGGAPPVRESAQRDASERGRTPAPDVKMSSGVSGYADTDAVYVASPTIGATVKDDVAGWSAGGRYVVDIVSAASVDIVSTASGKWNERRHVGSGSVDYKRDTVRAALSGAVSSEPDYLSIGGGGSLSVEIFDKNLTPSLGITLGRDRVGRTGQPDEYWKDLQTYGVQPGLTFVVDRSTIAAVAVDAIFERGYLAKPYRYIPLFTPGAAGALSPGASIDDVNRLRLNLRPQDNVPSSRDRYALSGRIAHRFDGATLRFDERLYADTWGLRASTSEALFYVDWGSRVTVWPHLRFHFQNSVSFWQLGYVGATSPTGVPTVPTYRSGDRELSSLYTATLGAGIRVRLTSGMRVPWVVSLSFDAARTRFLDALYVLERRTVLGSLALEGGFE